MKSNVRQVLRGVATAMCVCVAGAGWLTPSTAVAAPAGAQVALSPAFRGDVDRLMHLIGLRLAVARQVAQAKWNSGAPIDDPVREAQILDGLTAGLNGADAIDKAAVRQFFQDQFDAGKMIQYALHAQWHSQQHAPFANPPDLARDIRPQLDRLTPQLLEVLARVRPLLVHADAQTRMLIRVRAREDVPAVEGAVLDKALSSLLAE